MTSPTRRGSRTQPHHRRTRLEPSRSMPMAARRPQGGGGGSPTSTPRTTRSVVHISRRVGTSNTSRDAPPPRTYSGKGVTALAGVVSGTGTPNPYSSRGIVSIRSPTRSGKKSIQSMALSRGDSSSRLGGASVSAGVDLQPKMPKAVYQRARKDSNDFDKNQLLSLGSPAPSLNSKPSDGDLHGSWKNFNYDASLSAGMSMQDESDSNDKRRRLTSYGIVKSILKAATLIAFGFGGGYVYSNHFVGVNASAASQNSQTNLLDLDYSPWGYSPADPVIQKLLQHNKHEDVIGDIKSMKFPGRTPHEEPMLPGEINPLGAQEGDSWEHIRDPASIVNPDNIKSLDGSVNKNKANAAHQNQAPPPGENEPMIHPKDTSQQQFKFRHSQIKLRGAPPNTADEKASVPPGGSDQQQQGDNKDKDWNPQEEKLVHLVNRSARKIRLFWVPHGFIASQEQWVPMSDPYIDDGQDFYLHARPTHNFAVLEEPLPAQGATSLEFTVSDKDKPQKIVVYDNWKIEALAEEESNNNNNNDNGGDGANTASPLIHENPKEQHAPPEYMNNQKNSEQYWAEHAQKEAQAQQQQQQAQQQQQQVPEDPPPEPGAGQQAEQAARDQQAREQQERQAREQAEQQAQQEAQARALAEHEQQQQQQQQQQEVVVQQQQQQEEMHQEQQQQQQQQQQ